ncbi:hypothetical protein PI124_g11324 [Phytophthora idaei]|nr:hypothetical protein PI124_g11324 [Phytophthora idaei]
MEVQPKRTRKENESQHSFDQAKLNAAFKINSPGSRQVVTTLIEGGSRKKKILRYLIVASGKPVLRMMWIISLLRREGKHTRLRMSFSNSFVISVKDLETLSGIRLLKSHPVPPPYCVQETRDA